MKRNNINLFFYIFLGLITNHFVSGGRARIRKQNLRWPARAKRRIAALKIYPVSIIYTQMKCPNCQNLLLGLLSGWR